MEASSKAQIRFLNTSYMKLFYHGYNEEVSKDTHTAWHAKNLVSPNGIIAEKKLKN